MADCARFPLSQSRCHPTGNVPISWPCSADNFRKVVGDPALGLGSPNGSRCSPQRLDSSWWLRVQRRRVAAKRRGETFGPGLRRRPPRALRRTLFAPSARPTARASSPQVALVAQASGYRSSSTTPRSPIMHRSDPNPGGLLLPAPTQHVSQRQALDPLTHAPYGRRLPVGPIGLTLPGVTK